MIKDVRWPFQHPFSPFSMSFFNKKAAGRKILGSSFVYSLSMSAFMKAFIWCSESFSLFPYWKMGNLVCKFTVHQQECRMGVWSKGKEAGAKFWCYWKCFIVILLILLRWEREKCSWPPWEVLHSPEMEVRLSRDEKQPSELWKKKQLSVARSGIFSTTFPLWGGSKSG